MSLDIRNSFRSVDESTTTPMTSNSMAADSKTSEPTKPSFAEVALRLGGASEDEAKRTGALDTADDQVEALFADRYRTVNSPIHRAIWGPRASTEDFLPSEVIANDAVQKVVRDSLAVVHRHVSSGSLLNESGKISDTVLAELGVAGYWGLLVSPDYGGSGASMKEFSQLITRMAMLEPTVAGLASVHGCIGAVDPVRSFGNDYQKSTFLPKLASGKRLSAFALTEPGAGSDLTALRTTAVRDGDDYVVNGEKLFITNAIPGRTIGLVCRIEGKPAVLIVDLPEQESDTFQMRRYGLYALKRANNNGLIFRDFRVPASNLLTPSRGDGLTIAYHGLNLGRIALCANAAGTMRWMLSEMLPWAAYRETYGQAIDRRELVRRRLGRMAGMIVACDALTAWCAGLIDEGYRGEMECIIAKIYGSESQKEAAIELFMKTHGGRSFLQGHAFGDNVHEFLAPCIYEGEGEMLGMAFFKSLVKHHGQEYFESIGQILADNGIRQPNLANPRHLWMLRQPMMKYAGWMASGWHGTRWSGLPSMHRELAGHAKFAQRWLSKAGWKISGVMRQHQLKLADRQCRMSDLSASVQDAVVVLVTSLYAARSQDEVTRAAANAVCCELRRRMTGRAATDAEYRQLTGLGATIVEKGWCELEGAMKSEILMPYK